MKVQVFLSFALAVASASWIPQPTRYHGPEHVPVIHHGVPVETPEVQHAREYHLSALAKASSYPSYGHQESYENKHYEEKKYEGPQHIPVIHNGVPVDTAEVQHAKEAHLQAIAKAAANSKYDERDENDNYNNQHDNHYNQHDNHYNQHDNHYNQHDEHSYNHYNHHEDNSYNHYEHQDNHQHEHSYNHYNQHEQHASHHIQHAYETSHIIPQIGHDGKPLDTPEVEAAKAHHLAAVHKALASTATTKNYRHRRDAHWDEHIPIIAYNAAPKDTPEVENARAEHLLAHAAAKYAGENGYAIHQIHAPVYGYHGDHYVPTVGHDGKLQDTEEVEHAKAAHFAAHQEALARLHSHYEPEWKYAFEQ